MKKLCLLFLLMLLGVCLAEGGDTFTCGKYAFEGCENLALTAAPKS